MRAYFSAKLFKSGQVSYLMDVSDKKSIRIQIVVYSNRMLAFPVIVSIVPKLGLTAFFDLKLKAKVIPKLVAVGDGLSRHKSLKNVDVFRVL